MAVIFNDLDFSEKVVQAKGITVVDFFAEWCGPCKMIAPIIDEIASEYEGKALIGKVNVDDSPETAGKYGIRSIPTIMLIKDGEVIETMVGAVSKQTIAEKINSCL